MLDIIIKRLEKRYNDLLNVKRFLVRRFYGFGFVFLVT